MCSQVLGNRRDTGRPQPPSVCVWLHPSPSPFMLSLLERSDQRIRDQYLTFPTFLSTGPIFDDSLVPGRGERATLHAWVLAFAGLLGRLLPGGRSALRFFTARFAAAPRALAAVEVSDGF